MIFTSGKISNINQIRTLEPHKSNTDNPIPQNTDSDTCPRNTDKKENLETYKRDIVLDKAGSASAGSKSQASPVSLIPKKSLKGISKETIRGFIKDKGLQWVKDYLKKNGYDEKEIDSLTEVEGGDSEGTNTIESHKSEMS